MDQSVSPAATTCVAGSCPCSPDTGAGAAWEVSGARCEVSGRAWVVSCAASAGARPASSPATRASRAARCSERQIVVLLIQGLRERVERLRLALGRHLGCRPSLGPGHIAGAFPSAGATATAAPRRQEQHLPCDDLGGVARLLLAVLPAAVLDAPLDVDPVALLHVLLGQIRQLSALVVPADHPMPLGLFLLLPTLPRPLPTGRERQCRNPGAVRRGAHFGIRPQVPD